MAAVPNAVPSATPDATTAYEWLSDPASMPVDPPVPPSGNLSAPVAPFTASPIPPDVPVLATPPGSWLPDMGDHSGAWPVVPDDGNTALEPIQRPSQERAHPVFEGNRAEINPDGQQRGVWTWVKRNILQGAQSQVTDTMGWHQYYPSGRVSEWRTFGVSNPDNVPEFQYEGAHRPTEKWFPQQAPQVSSDGVVQAEVAPSIPSDNIVWEAPTPPIGQPVPETTAYATGGTWG